MVWIYLDLDDVLVLARLAELGPVRDVGLLGSAVARPQQSAFGEDAYPTLWEKAAALLHSVANNHALIDGNKRLAWIATATFLDLNSYEADHVGTADVVSIVLDVVTTTMTIAETARRLRALIERSESPCGDRVGDRFSW